MSFIEMPNSALADEIESNFAINYLGHYSLLAAYFQRIHKMNKKCLNSANICTSRIVILSSCAHLSSPLGINYNELKQKTRSESEFDFFTSYSQSKLALIYFAKLLAKKMNESEQNSENANKCLVTSVHPGFVYTDIFNDTFGTPNTFCRTRKCLLRSKLEGAQTILYCGFSQKLAKNAEQNFEKYSGKYYENCKLSEHHSSDICKNLGEMERLYEFSKEMTGLDFEFL